MKIPPLFKTSNMTKYNQIFRNKNFLKNSIGITDTIQSAHINNWNIPPSFFSTIKNLNAKNNKKINK